MNLKKQIPAVLAFILISFFSAQAQIQPKQEAALLSRYIEAFHYAPPTLNDSLCKEISEYFLRELDPKKIYFSQVEIEKIQARSFALRSDFKGTTWEYLPYVVSFFKTSLEQLNLDLQNYYSASIDLQKGDSVARNAQLPIAANPEQLKKYRQAYFKHQVLVKMSSLPDSVVNMPGALREAESKARNRCLKAEKKKIQQLLEYTGGLEVFLARKLLNAYTLSLDAHSVYMPPDLFEQWMGHLDTEAMSFGFELNENEEGEVFIHRIIPGGNAWKTNDLFKGDILLGATPEGGKWLSFDGMNLDEVQETMLRWNSILLQVKEPSGRVKNVPVKKGRIRNEENKVKGVVLNGAHRIGYISLPGFYAEWENASAGGCSNDVAREILKLKEEGIEGIILDIRYNGGGSLAEGLNMAGIFINEGPLYLKKDRSQKVQVIKDQNRGTVYDGPLVVMINGQSASASELLAAVLQDYNRAVLVGSRSYGKATGQQVLPLDSINRNPSASRHGYSLITTQKLFRITGKTAQRNGVQPDIEFPDYMDGFQDREEDLPTALSAEEVNKKVYFTPLAALPLEQLRTKSKERTAKSKIGEIPELISGYWQMPNKKVLTLTFYRSQYQKYSKLWLDIEKCLRGKDSIYRCEATKEMKQLLDFDEFERENFQYLNKNLMEDEYLKESFRILCDWIEIK
ncbi:MAG: S41 family peptidase [Cytophagaceae bacterium]|jgi:carboxyl-terminal processing protease|nr:S41 family peptidase [Cytophagaceae bacterium]